MKHLKHFESNSDYYNRSTTLIISIKEFIKLGLDGIKERVEMIEAANKYNL